MSMIETLFALTIAVWILYQLYQGYTRPRPLILASLRNAEVVYLDDKNAKVFVSYRYGIKGKPDVIIRLPDRSMGIVEYKSRSTRIYDSDRKQIIATALAVRETYADLKHGYAVLENGETEHIDLSSNSELLRAAIDVEYRTVESAQQGNAPSFTPVKYKCRNCGVRHGCSSAV